MAVISSFVRPCLCLALGLALLAGTSARGAEPGETAQRAVHLLDYIAVDYPEAVRDGNVINPLEYAEQREFTGLVESHLERLEVGVGDPLRVGLGELREAIESRAAAAVVAERARTLGNALRVRFGVRALPSGTPSLERGRELYRGQCATCHGPEGRGDGPAGTGLDPAPTDFTDRTRADALSPFTLFSTISFGIDQTGMVGFAQALSADERYDLAFYTGSLSFAPQEIERGRELARLRRAALRDRVPDLATLVDRPVSELARDADERALVAYLRTHPGELEAGTLPLEIARARLAESWGTYAAGDASGALDLAISAYLDGFEHVEAALDVVSPELRSEIEIAFMRYRGLLRDRAPRDSVETARAVVDAGLLEAQDQLAAGGLGPAAVFAGALTILLREGLEAVLIVVALLGVAIRGGRRDAVRYVHAGWIAAALAGSATWLAAQALIDLSGARRELIEGLSSLLATAILFYVSYWLITERWQTYLRESAASALSRGSLFTLAGVAFLAVYRELLETVLFFQALSAQAGPAGARPLLAGIAAGAVLLAGLAVAVFRLGLRLPMRAFFQASSALLYALAVVLAGQGVAALQEVGWLPATWVPGIRIEWLGIYPTAETLLLQGVLVAAALVAAGWLALARRQRPATT